MSAIMDVDGLSNLPEGAKCASEQRFINRATFDSMGRQVEELICDLGNGIRRLVWCYAPMEKMIIEHDRGKPTYRCEMNFLHHCDFTSNLPESEEEARAKVRQSFDEYQGSKRKHVEDAKAIKKYI